MDTASDAVPERGAQPADGNPYADRIRVEFNRIFIRQAARFPNVVVLLLPVLAYVLHEDVRLANLLIWFGGTAATLLVRWGLARTVLSRGVGEERIALNARIAGAVWTLAALVAGTAPMFWFPLLSIIERTIFTLGFFTWYAAVVAVSLVSTTFALLWGVCLLGPLAVAWELYGGEGGLAVTFLCVLMLVFVWQASEDARAAMREALELRMREADLSLKVSEHSRQLEAAMRAKSQFLAAASHDLRQPVTSLNLLLSALTASRDERSLRDVAAKFEAPLQALEEILSSLLEMSRLEAGIIRVEKTTSNVRDIVHAVADEYRPRVVSKRLSIEVSAPAIEIWTDPDLVRRILRNLVDNAVKYTEAGLVRIDAYAVGSDLQIVVSDSGRGIPAEIRDRIFDDYFQGENPQRDRRQGLGLGLSIVRRLVDLLGGSVRVAPEYTAGARFVVTLPGAANWRKGSSTAPAAREARPALNVTRVLIVEDDKLVVDALATLFRTLNLDVRFAQDGAEAMSTIALGRFTPELALVDFGLPGAMDGIVIIEELKRRLPRCAFLLVTGDTRSDVIRKASDAGVPVLHKPVTLERIQDALGRIRVPA